MPYLVTSETIAHVDIECILGVAENSIEVFSILNNFFKSSDTFEEFTIYNTIIIWEISEDNIKFFNKLFEKYEEHIDKLLQDNTYQIEDLYQNYKCIPYINSEDIVIFTKKEVKQIENIIENATQIL